MLRQVLEAIAVGGYVAGALYHIYDVLELPIPLIGLAWVLAVRCMPPIVPSISLFWVTYALLVYQLISFHDFNACLLEECHTDQVYSYIAVVSTGVFWFSLKDKNSTKYDIKPSPKQPKVEPKVEPKVKPKFPALKIRVQQEKKPSGPLRLNMGESIQPKWV